MGVGGAVTEPDPHPVLLASVQSFSEAGEKARRGGVAAFAGLGGLAALLRPALPLAQPAPAVSGKKFSTGAAAAAHVVVS